MFGASSLAPAAGGLFGAPAASTLGFGAPTAPAGGGLFGASAPAAGGGGLFGAAPAATPGFGAPASTPGFGAPAAGGGLFGASAPAQGGGLFGAPAAPAPGGLFGASQPALGGGLFGASQPAVGGGMFGASTPGAGGMFGPGAQNQLAVAQPQQGVLATVDGQPVKHFTQWGELAQHSQQQLQLIEQKIVQTREDSKFLDGISRLQGENGGSRNGQGGAVRRRELERAATSASDALKLLETQLWSDGERLGGLREAVVATLRDTEHVRARLTRLKAADDADQVASAHQRTQPGTPPPPEATPVYLPLPKRPSEFLKGSVDRLYAAAEGFERGTLEMERNLRTTGRVHGHGGCGPGLEALSTALRGGNLVSASNGGDENLSSERFDSFTSDLNNKAGPAELRAAVERAQRYFNKVGGDLARLHEKVRRAKAEHLAELRRRNDHRDPFAEAEAAEAEYTRLSAMAERPGFASGPPAGLPGGAIALPAPGAAIGGIVQTPGSAFPGGALAASPGMFGATPTPAAGGVFGATAAAPATSGGLFGASTAGGLFGASSPAPAAGGLFGASAPAAGGGLFGAAGPASTPAPGGGLFGAVAPASSPAPGGGLFGAGAPASIPAAGGLFGAAAPAAGGFGSPAAAAGAGLFDSPAPAAGGGLFGAPAAGGFCTPGAFGAPPTQQPRRSRRR